MKKIILGLVAAAAVAAPLALSAAPANAGTNIAEHDQTVGYQDTFNADYSQTKTTNGQWTIVNSTLVVKVNTGYEGWVTTITFTQKTPVAPVGNRVPSSTGTVTHVTPYGTGSQSFTAPVGSAAPFWYEGGNLVTDWSSPAGAAIRGAQDAIFNANNMANTAYWLP